MACTVRVQLVDVDEGDEVYETLHEAMDEKGFARTIRGSSGTLYEMPMGSYTYESGGTAEEVYELAKQAASTTGKSARIFVTQAAGRFFGGLKRA